MAKYEMTMDLNILNHLGLNLYSNTPAVLSEVVANSYDADATTVDITLSQEDGMIEIVDDGNGMTLDDVNNKFLLVGYQKRNNGEARSLKYNRSVMGRKGIGKLSLLSIANSIEIHTISEGGAGNAFQLLKSDIELQIDENGKTYYPKEIAFIPFGKRHGTKIVISDLKKNINRTPEFLRPRLARRFSISTSDFIINLNGVPITLKDRNFFSKVEFLWPIGKINTEIKVAYPDLNIQGSLTDIVEGTSYQVSGWIATVDKPSDLKDGNSSNNKISIVCRGKLAQEDILSFYNEGGIYSSYLIGEIRADFLDEDSKDDIATSNRQQLNENDERFTKLQGYVYKRLKEIQKRWSELRNDASVSKAISQMPVLNEWYNTLKGDSKKHAKKLFATIENLHFDKDVEKKKEIYRYGVLAFERLRIADKLSELENVSADNLIHFGSIFSEIQDIEAALYYDIASQRVKIIQKIKDCCYANEKERVIQKYLFDNLWLLDASWDRATKGSEILEQSVITAFGKITNKLSDDEKKGRIDIRYRTSAGKHIIIELKRYNATYKITKFTLGEQVEKYYNALSKCLITTGVENPYIEAICVVGPGALEDLNGANKLLGSVHGRVMTYDELIDHALTSYAEYLDRNEQVGKIRTLVDRL